MTLDRCCERSHNKLMQLSRKLRRIVTSIALSTRKTVVPIKALIGGVGWKVVVRAW
jgi:hypothetical protein